MILDYITIPQIIVLLAVYSFLGWIIEVVYRSFTQRQLINAGFLYGPFIPIYGFGALFIIFLDYIIRELPLPVKLFAYGIILTVIEYLTGLLFEKIFQLKLWDYSNNKINLHGRVCLLFSTFWAVMAVVFVHFIHPLILRYVQSFREAFLNPLGVLLFIYGVTDLVFSIVSINAFRRKIAYLYAEYFNLSNAEIEKIFNSLRRLRTAFPHLSRYIDSNIDREIKGKINVFLKSIMSKIRQNI